MKQSAIIALFSVIVTVCFATAAQAGQHLINAGIGVGGNYFSITQAGGALRGNVSDAEKAQFVSNNLTQTPQHNAVFLALKADYIPAPLNFGGNYLFGVRTVFGIYSCDQTAVVNGKAYNEPWTEYVYASVGPVIYISLFPDGFFDNFASKMKIYLSLTALYSGILSGSIQAAPVLRSAGYQYNDNKTSFGGNRISFGGGPVVKMGMFNFGANMLYAKTFADVGILPAQYGALSGKSTYTEWYAEIYASAMFSL